MKGKKSGRGIKILIAALLAALIGVVGVIAFKEYEYRQSERYYDGLRGVEVQQ